METEQIVNQLQSLGLRVRVESPEAGPPPPHPLGRVDDPYHVGSIEVMGGPISWVHLLHDDAHSEFDRAEHHLLYAIPDERLGSSGRPDLSIRWSHAAQQWRSTEGVELTHRLNEDPTISDPMVNHDQSYHHFEIRADHTRACWSLKCWSNHVKGFADLAPNLEEWAGLQAIARHLLLVAIDELEPGIDELEPSFTTRAERIEWNYLLHLGNTLKGFGVDALPLERDPFEGEAAVNWLELSTGPIRWIELLCMDLDPPTVWMLCHVLDPRITSDLPGVVVEPVRVRTFPLLGRVRAVKWEVKWEKKGGALAPRDHLFGLHMADHLSQDVGLTETIISAGQTFRYAGPRVEGFDESLSRAEGY